MDYATTNQIYQYTEAAILAMNSRWSFDEMRYNLDKAFELCSPQTDLDYYEIIATVFRGLAFRTNGFNQRKLRKKYAEMYEYLAQKFSNISQFEAHGTKKSELDVVNQICVDVHQGAIRYFEAFLKGAMHWVAFGIVFGIVFGVVAWLTSYRKVKKMFIPHIRSIANSACGILRRYPTKEPLILQNIEAFEQDAK